MSPRWRKVLADLRDNKIRTLLVVLSIGVGVFAVGSIAGAFDMIETDMQAAYQSVNPHSAIVYTSGFDEDLVAALRRVPGVAAAEGRSTLGARIRVADDSLLQVSVTAIPSSGPMEIDRLRRIDGGDDLRLGRHEGFLEMSAQQALRVKPGDPITIELSDQRARTLRVAGIVQDLTQPTVSVGGAVSLFVTPDTMEWLGGSALYNRLVIVASERATDEQHVKAVADEVADKMSGAGLTVHRVFVNRPGIHWARQVTDALLAVMAGLGVLTVALSAFLVTNTITALLGQQLRQIGVLKAIGAQRAQVLGLYLALVVSFGLLALLISLPLAGWMAWLTASFVAGMLSFDLAGFRIPPLAFILEFAVAVLLPLAAALLPIWNGTRVTVREAIADYGLGQGDTGRGLIDRALASLRGLPRPWMLSLRNAFRRKGRMALTLATLTLGGAIFISVLDLQAAFNQAIAEAFGYVLSDVNVDLKRPYRVDEIEALIERVPGLRHIEAWVITNAQAQPVDPADPAVDVQLIAPPPGSSLIRPVLTAGRWLVPEDENAIVIGNHMTSRRPDLHVGDWITLRISERDSQYQVVGIYKAAGNLSFPILYMSSVTLARQASLVGRSQSYRIATIDTSPNQQKAVAREIEKVLAAQKIEVSNLVTGAELQAQQASLIGILVVFMLVMAVLIAIVGGLGLMGTMSMNVLERTREIGVLRAIGASTASIMGMILLEGILIGGLSWGLGSVLSLPIGAALCAMAGIAFVTVPMPLTIEPSGFVIWLLIALVLSAVASLLPAWNASRTTIRQVLAYE